MSFQVLDFFLREERELLSANKSYSIRGFDKSLAVN